jgi:hypothetical protein
MRTDTRLTALLAQVGISAPHALTPLGGGGNNRVFRLDTRLGQLVLKEYFHHPDDPRDRLGAEFGFSQFAWEHGVRNIPRPLASDPDRHLGLYAFVDGVRPDKVESSAVDQALSFVTQLNGLHQEGHRLPSASEACFSIDAHLERVALRVARLRSVDDAQARRLVRDALQPAWSDVQTAVVDAADALGILTHAMLRPADRCISPSDFGFHNALLDTEGRYWFLDFEYAGWDDPAKLVCDFFCQPARPVPPELFDTLATEVSRGFDDPDWHLKRMRLLWPVFELKWACILLNEFLPEGSRRRQFAGADSRGPQRQRLERSRYLISRAVDDVSHLQDIRTCRI